MIWVCRKRKRAGKKTRKKKEEVPNKGNEREHVFIEIKIDEKSCYSIKSIYDFMCVIDHMLSIACNYIRKYFTKSQNFLLFKLKINQTMFVYMHCIQKSIIRIPFSFLSDCLNNLTIKQTR